MVDTLLKAGFTSAQADALISCFQSVSKQKEFAKHFNRAEFACGCGGAHCNGFPAEPSDKLVELLDDVRGLANTPCIISSGVRCERHNHAVGGVANSYHKTGRAADFRLSGKNSAETLAYCQRFKGRYIELYAIDLTYVHIAV